MDTYFMIKGNREGLYNIEVFTIISTDKHDLCLSTHFKMVGINIGDN